MVVVLQRLLSYHAGILTDQKRQKNSATNYDYVH